MFYIFCLVASVSRLISHYDTMTISLWHYETILCHYDIIKLCICHNDNMTVTMTLWLSHLGTLTMTVWNYDYVTKTLWLCCYGYNYDYNYGCDYAYGYYYDGMNVIEGSKGKIRKGMQDEEENGKIR